VKPADPSLLVLSSDQCQQAARARDARFDGVFFIGVTTTGIYCRPICPARVVYSDRRRFFVSAAAAERAGYRPCLRCRPELAPGRAPVDAVSRLAFAAALRIGAGALNEGSVSGLAQELGVSERHLRRALERQLGVSPIELAQTHRLLLAKRLLADTALPVTHIAFASGFQSLRRFNTVFRERYQLSPSRLRQAARPESKRKATSRRAPAVALQDFVRLTLAYRAPLAWDVLLGFLSRDAIPGTEIIEGSRYGCTISLDGRKGVVFATGPSSSTSEALRASATHLDLEISLSLVPSLMPLLARVRQLFDLDAEPNVIDGHLERAGLSALVAQRPGVRIPGAVDGFAVLLGTVLRGVAPFGKAAQELTQRVVQELGEPLDGGHPLLNRIAPTPARIDAAGPTQLRALGVTARRAMTLARAAKAILDGQLRLEPGSDIIATRRTLLGIEGIHERLATEILIRTLYWPDAFAVTDRALQRAAGVNGPGSLRALAERWRPWRAYASLHLWLRDREPSHSDS
jgi:AraC family transcriptional regulator of adaptative response / DNA-3-methyladenine glycosylase II